MFTATFTHQGWKMDVFAEQNIVNVHKDNVHRTYDMPHQICMVGQNKAHPDYVRIDFEDTDEYLVFKFEENNFLVGDIYRTGDDEDDFVREFAMYVFGED